ncbi:MAG: DUF2818 family protein [Candidimonas sp.]|jgi:hypothetical protein
MAQTTAIWITIVLALITANLPFFVERPFLATPWRQPGEPARPAWLAPIEFLFFVLALAALSYAAWQVIGHGFFIASDPLSLLAHIGKVFGILSAVAAVLAYPGWRSRGHAVRKTFLVRILEVMMFYALVGVLGLAFEASLGNVFAQTWEFYAITMSLFLVLAYPGFVFRYLMRRSKKAERSSPSKHPRDADAAGWTKG